MDGSLSDSFDLWFEAEVRAYYLGCFHKLDNNFDSWTVSLWLSLISKPASMILA
jgi:hypothetical protein